jgi:hypothetical protein
VLVPTSATSGGLNWLITGSDGRGGLTPAQDNALSLGRNISGARPDTIMLLHIPANGTRPFGGYATESAGSVVRWDTSAAKQMFSDLGNDKALPKSLITGSSVEETS